MSWYILCFQREWSTLEVHLSEKWRLSSSLLDIIGAFASEAMNYRKFIRLHLWSEVTVEAGCFTAITCTSEVVQWSEIMLSKWASLYLTKPQQSVNQWRPFSNDNEANAHKSKWWHLKNIRHRFHWMVPDCQALTCRANDTGARHMLRVSSSVWQGNRSSQWVADDMKRLGIQVYFFHKLKWPC